MNCDAIAPFYRFLEKAAFGGRLQRHRVAFLTAAIGKHRALILGDGDGRFTQTLVLSYPDLKVDSIELSAGMVAEARKRVSTGRHVRIAQGDVFRFPFPGAAYDIVFTHFFLDCFNAQHLSELISRLSEALTPEAVWVISDFREAHSGWRRFYTRLWLKSMYLFFRLATGLKTKSLSSYREALEAAGFTTRTERVSSDGLLASELWQR